MSVPFNFSLYARILAQKPFSRPKSWAPFESIPPLMLPPKREMAHTIPSKEGSKPPFRPIYRLSSKELEEAKRQVQEYLEKCWIEFGASPYRSPIFLYRLRMEL
jgi:hypothetical protein